MYAEFRFESAPMRHVMSVAGGGGGGDVCVCVCVCVWYCMSVC